MGGAKNCPETPRQKMIGMMYLVLTAMLALNVSTDILNGFVLVDTSLHASIQASQNRNVTLYQNFSDAKSQNEEKVGPWYEKAMELQKESDDLYNYIQGFKEHIAILADGEEKVEARRAAGEDPTLHIEGNSNLDVAGQYALVQMTDGKLNGQIMKDRIAHYREYLCELAGENPKMRSQINAMFATSKGWNSHEGDSCEWEVAVFDGMPVGATVTILTKLQNDIRSTEGQMITHLMDKTDASDIRVNKMQAYVIPNSNYVIRGGRYTARIVLAAVDSTQTPSYYVNGQQLGSDGIYTVGASGVGTKKFTGKIGYLNPEGVEEFLDFTSEYSVGEPSATISNTDLNIMYRGYENKFSISVPGVSNDKVKVSANGASLTQKNGMFIIKPGEGSKTVTVNVQAQLDGKWQSMGSQEYRVKALPKPSAYFRSGEKEYSEGNIARSALLNANAVVIASYGPDGLLNLPFTITSFRIQTAVGLKEARGNKITSEQRAMLEKLKMGAMISLVDIRAKGPDGTEKRLSPIVLTLN